jgi:hypothetical protein
MADAERASISPRDAAQDPLPERRTSNWEHWELLALAVLGATFGFLSGIGLFSEIHERSLDTALLVIILALAAYVFIDPIKEWLDKPGTSSHEAPEGRRMAALLAAVPGLLVAAIIHHSLSAAEEPHELVVNGRVLTIGGWGFAFVVFCAIAFASLCVTHFGWVRGVQRQPRRAAQRGAIASLVVGIILAALLIWYLHDKDLLPLRPWGIWVGLLAVLWFVGPGFLGGLAINRCRDNSSPSTCIIRHFVLWSVGYLAILLGFGLVLETMVPPPFQVSQGMVKAWKETVNTVIWLPVAAMITMNLGWAFALYFRRKVCDRHLGLSGECGYTPPKEPPLGPGLALVPRDRGPAPEPVTGEKPIPPAEMLLKPTGDRLWATLVLVLMLAVAGLAFYAGAMRKDPEIINNILIRLQQDSGLQQKGLKVHAAGRVVTLAGVVDNEFEHEKAVQEAASVRGVKQVIDQIQVAPAAPAAPPPTPAVIAPAPPPAPALNATVPIVAPQGPAPKESGSPSQAGAQKHPETQKAASAQRPHDTTHPAKANKQVSTASAEKQAETPKTPDTQKKGFFSFLKKTNPTGTADAEKQGATSTTADAQKSTTTDTQKKGFFHFLKKNNNKKDQTTSNASH